MLRRTALNTSKNERCQISQEFWKTKKHLTNEIILFGKQILSLLLKGFCFAGLQIKVPGYRTSFIAMNLRCCHVLNSNLYSHPKKYRENLKKGAVLFCFSLFWDTAKNEARNPYLPCQHSFINQCIKKKLLLLNCLCDMIKHSSENHQSPLESAET